MVELRVRPALLTEEKELLARLMQLYLHDYSEFEVPTEEAERLVEAIREVKEKIIFLRYLQ